MAIQRYLINLLWLYTKSMRSVIYATNSKLDLSNAVNIAYFFVVLLYIMRRKITSIHFTSHHCEYMGKGISVYRTAELNEL